MSLSFHSATRTLPSLDRLISHTIVVQLNSAPRPDFSAELETLIGPLSRSPGCMRYSAACSPEQDNLWIVNGQWVNASAMSRHFNSQPLQHLIEHLKSIQVMKLEFSCYGL